MNKHLSETAESQPSFGEVVAEIFEVLEQTSSTTGLKGNKEHKPLAELVELALCIGGTRRDNAEIMVGRLTDYIGYKSAVHVKNGENPLEMAKLMVAAGKASELLQRELEPQP